MAACERCGAEVVVTPQQRERFPGWAPRLCQDCFRATSRGRGTSRSASAAAGELQHTLDEVLALYHLGPDTGVFTDGSASPNPGPGGWGAVYVVDDVVVASEHGHERDTTNNRMELTALTRGVELVPEGTAATLYTDSKLCVDTLTEWAAGWAARGWKRKRGEIANLDLVRPLWERLQARPELEVVWVKAHAGQKWNEYADALATAWMRDRL